METVNLALFDKSQIQDNGESYSAKPILQTPSINPLADIEKTLESIFPEDHQQTRVNKARHTLGLKAESYSDVQIETLVTDFEFLAAAWLDLFEKNIFNGKTLREVLGEGKGK